MMLAVVWGAAAIGMAVKLIFPGRFDRLAVLFYLAIGWSGVMILRPVADTLPPTTLWLIAAGGLVYSIGVVFFVWHRLRFQNAVWHAFVVIAAGLHLAAVMDCLVINRL
jgi:hemolysin III